uniref:Uncharacterized protein n=1 Tax=Anguilla anguilla TaxID=7936 RepID=A0A0E9ULS3_ANGAN
MKYMYFCYLSPLL